MPVFVKTATGWSKIPRKAIDIKIDANGFKDVNQVWIKHSATDISEYLTKTTSGRVICRAAPLTNVRVGFTWKLTYNHRDAHNKWNVTGSNNLTSATNLVAPMTGIFIRQFDAPISTGKVSRVRVKFTYSLLDVSGKGKWLGKLAPKLGASASLYSPGTYNNSSSPIRTYDDTLYGGEGSRQFPVNNTYHSAPAKYYYPANIPTSETRTGTHKPALGRDSTIIYTYSGTINPRRYYNDWLHPSYWWSMPQLTGASVVTVPALGTATGAIVTTEQWITLPTPTEPGGNIYVYFYGATCSSVESISDLPNPLAFKVHEVSITGMQFSQAASAWGFVWGDVEIKNVVQGQWWQLGGREGVDNGKIITGPTSKEAELWGGTLLGKDIFTAKRYERIKRIKIAVNISEAYGSWHGSGGRYWVTTKEKNVTSQPAGAWGRNQSTGYVESPWFDVDISPNETIRIVCKGNGDSGDAKVIRGVKVVDVEFE